MTGEQSINLLDELPIISGLTFMGIQEVSTISKLDLNQIWAVQIAIPKQ